MNDDSNNHINYERAAANAICYNPKKKHNDNNRIESTSLQSQQSNSMSREFHNSATDAALAAAANASSNHNNYNNKVPNTSADDLADRLISYAQNATSNQPISRQQQTSPQTPQVVGNTNVNIMNNRGNSSAMVKPPPPPPPPPPPRRSQNLSSPTLDTKSNNMSASNINCNTVPPTPASERNFSRSTGNLSQRGMEIPQSKQTILSPRERELEHEKEQLEHKNKVMEEQLRIANLKLAKSEQSPKGVPKGGILKNSIPSNSGKSNLNASYQGNMNMSSSLSSNDKNEAQFIQFASMSLNDLDNNSKTNKQKNRNMMSSVQEFNNSSMSVSSREGFSPRPVKISQFDDNDNNDKNTKAATSTTTTASFVNSIRKLPYEKKQINNLNPINTPVEDIQTPNSIMSPSSMKSPASSSVVRTVDTLPDNVDKKGRCLKHPNIKLFKKKLLGGSYDIIRESCPSCIEEAPYQNLWKSQAKTRGFKKWQEERGEPSRLMDRDIVQSRERGRSFDDSATASRSVSSRSRERSSRSKSRERRKKSQERRSKSRERRRDEMPYVPALQGYTNDLTKKRHTPPQPPNHPPYPSSQSSNIRGSGDLQRRGRCRSKDDRGRVLEIPAESSVTSELTPVSLPHTQTLFDKGINTLASLQSRARSSSRKRQGKSSASDNGPSRPSRSISPKTFNYLNVKSGVATLGPNKTKKSSTKIENVSASELSKKHLAFDKKTGRCKYHPSIILAKKSPFAKGWDIIKDTCPFCAEAKSSAEDQFGEISKKMNKLLGGQGNSLKSYTASESNEGISSSEKRRHKSPSQKQAIVEGNFTAPETNRVSRMPYTAPSGECSGWYTGEVNSHGKPHGNGRMRCKTGRSIEGEWYQGESLDYLEKKGRIKAGFGTNVAPWKEDPRVASSSVESGQQPSSNQQVVMSSQQYQGPPPQQQQQAYYAAAPQMPAHMAYNSQGYQQQYFQAPVQQQQQQQPGNQNQMNPRQQGY